jgi:hypothetical protein
VADAGRGRSEYRPDGRFGKPRASELGFRRSLPPRPSGRQSPFAGRGELIWKHSGRARLGRLTSRAERPVFGGLFRDNLRRSKKAVSYGGREQPQVSNVRESGGGGDLARNKLGLTAPNHRPITPISVETTYSELGNGASRSFPFRLRLDLLLGRLKRLDDLEGYGGQCA